MPQKVSAKQLYVHLPSSQDHGETCQQHSKNRQQRSESLRSLGSFEPSCFMRRSCRRLSDRGHATRKLLSHRSLRHKSRVREGEGEREKGRGRGREHQSSLCFDERSENFSLLMIYTACLIWEIIALDSKPHP